MPKLKSLKFYQNCKAQYIIDLHLAKTKAHREQIEDCLVDVEKKIKSLIKPKIV